MDDPKGTRASRCGRVWLLATSTLFFLLTLGAVPSPDDSPSTWSLKQWTEWREYQIQRILTPTFDAGGRKILSREEVIARSVDAFKVLLPLLPDPGFLGDKDRRAILGNFTSFVRAQSAMAYHDENLVYTHALGFDITDREYWTHCGSQLRFPDLLSSQPFLADLADPSTYKSAVDRIEAQNALLPPGRKWVVLMYRSRFLKSVDTSTYGRLLVFVPNQPEGDALVDRWIQFALETPGISRANGGQLRSVSMVAVRRTAIGGSDPEVYFADFMRDRDPTTGKFSVTPTMLEAKNPSKNCYECHKAPVLPIHPKLRYKFDRDGRLVEQALGANATVELLNDRIAGYGKADFGLMNTSAFGPSIGPAGRLRTDAFIDLATKDAPAPQEAYSRIRSAMNCGSCHDGFAKLNYPAAVNGNIGFLIFEQKQGLVQTYIENGWMPPGNTLTPIERHALWECLDREYFDPERKSGVLFDWLRGTGP